MCLCLTQCRSSLPANLIDDHGDNAGEAGILVGETDPIAGEGDPAVGEGGFPAVEVHSTAGKLDVVRNRLHRCGQGRLPLLALWQLHQLVDSV